MTFACFVVVLLVETLRHHELSMLDDNTELLLRTCSGRILYVYKPRPFMEWGI